MTCQDFKDHLPEYLDETLEPRRHAAAREHVAGCAGCRSALAQQQAFGRVLQHAFNRATAGILLTPDSIDRILLAAQPRPDAAAARPRVWRWLPARRIGALGAAAALVVVLIIAGQWLERPANPAAPPRPVFYHQVVEVPFHTDGRTGVIHAEFSEPTKPQSLPP